MNPFNWKFVFVLLVVFPICLLCSFISEITYKKRTLGEVKKDSKKIIRKTSFIYAVFVIATIVYQVLGITFEEWLKEYIDLFIFYKQLSKFIGYQKIVTEPTGEPDTKGPLFIQYWNNLGTVLLLTDFAGNPWRSLP